MYRSSAVIIGTTLFILAAFLAGCGSEERCDAVGHDLSGGCAVRLVPGLRIPRVPGYRLGGIRTETSDSSLMVELTYGPEEGSQGPLAVLKAEKTPANELDPLVIAGFPTVEVVQGTRVGLDDGETSVRSALVVDHVFYQLTILGDPHGPFADLAQTRAKFVDAIVASPSQN